MLASLWIPSFFRFKGLSPNSWMFPTALSCAWRSLCFYHNVIRSGNTSLALSRPYLAKGTQLPSACGILLISGGGGLYWKPSTWDWIREGEELIHFLLGDCPSVTHHFPSIWRIHTLPWGQSGRKLAWVIISSQSHLCLSLDFCNSKGKGWHHLHSLCLSDVCNKCGRLTKRRGSQDIPRIVNRGVSESWLPFLNISYQRKLASFLVILQLMQFCSCLV